MILRFPKLSYASEQQRRIGSILHSRTLTHQEREWPRMKENIPRSQTSVSQDHDWHRMKEDVPRPQTLGYELELGPNYKRPGIVGRL